MDDAQLNPLRWTSRRVALATAQISAVLAGAWIAYQCAGVLVLVFVAVLLATALAAPISWLQRAGLSRPLGSVVVHVVVISLLAGGVLLIWPLASQQASNLIASLPDEYQQLRQHIVDSDHYLTHGVAALLPTHLEAWFENGSAAEPAGAFVSVWGAGEAVLWAAFLALATVLMSAYWSIERTRIVRGILFLFPMARRAAASEIFSEIEGKLGAFVRGQALLCLLVGLMAFAAYWLIGLPNAALLAIVAGVCESVPIIGPIVGTIPAALAAFSLGPTAVLSVIGASTVIASIESYILVPRIMNRELGLHPVVTLLAITALFGLLGPVGGVLAVPLAALVQIAFQRWVFRAGTLHGEPSPPAGLRDRRGILLYRTERLFQDLHLLMSRPRRTSRVDQLEKAEEGLEAIIRDLGKALQSTPSGKAPA